MSWQQAIPAVLSVVSASGKVSAGNAVSTAGIDTAQNQRAVMQYEADQARVNAGQVQAAAQRTAMEQRRQGAIVQSRALALAAAGGGSTSDPGIVNLIAGNAGEIAYRSAVALYEGEDKARTMEAFAKGKEYSGAMAVKSAYQTADNTRSASRVGAFGDLVKGGASLFSAFGGGGVGADAGSVGAGLDNWGGT